MNKSLKYTVVIVLILIIIYYFLQKSNSTKQLNNEVSLVEQTVIGANISTPKVPKELPKTTKVVSDNGTNENKPEIGDDREVNYLTAYREYKQFGRCTMVYHKTQNGVHLISDYIQSYIKPNETQVQYYQIYIDTCLSLKLSEKESGFDARRRLSKRLDETTPETKEEIALSQALEIENRIQNFTHKIFEEKNGNNQLTDAQIKDKEKRIDALYEEVMIVINRNEGNTSKEDMLLIQKIMKEIDALNVVNNFDPNAEEIEYLHQELTHTVFELKEFFRDNQTPDIFFIFADHLLNERMGKFFFTDDLNNKLGIYDTDYINSLNKAIVPFIACSLDFPCGPESYLSIKHCTHPVGFEPKSCGKSIEDYYLEDLISPNQMIDFNNYFNYLLDNYAQN